MADTNDWCGRSERVSASAASGACDSFSRVSKRFNDSVNTVERILRDSVDGVVLAALLGE